MVEGGGFEPPKAKPADLQSALVDRLSTPPVPLLRSCSTHKCLIKRGANNASL